MKDERRMQISLFSLRLGIFAVFLVWTLDKIVNYQHSSKVFGHYYGLELSEYLLAAVGLAELVLILAFLGGVKKTLTYGVVLCAHTIATLASAKRLIPPYESHQLLYFAALPMLAACLALFLMRTQDTMMTLSSIKKSWEKRKTSIL